MTYTTTHHNVETDKIEVRDLTADEIADIEASQEAKAQRNAENDEKAIIKAAILERLGLSENEAKLLLS